jgi:O-acetyl-ADP-ribose deacetylase (regulator of RNase III)
MRGWVRRSDRALYVTDEGIDNSLNELWGQEVPRRRQSICVADASGEEPPGRFAFRAALNI